MKDRQDEKLAPMLTPKVDVVIDGVTFRAGISRIRADHALVRGHEDLFEELPEAEQDRHRHAITRISSEPIRLVEPAGRLN